ncbi:MAG TPA: NDP-sugar synthase [Candidatus Bathyarchaeia archaeon]
MKVLILAGGFGTRLRPISCTRPKSLLQIVNKPLLQWIYERLAKNNITEAILAVNHFTEVYIKQNRIPKSGLTVKYSRDPLRKPLGTGGPIRKAERLIGHDETFLVLNGDIFADVNYTEILKQHRENGAVATMALHKVEDPSRYGVAELAENNRIKRFVEKPPRKTAPSNLINAGVYALDPKIFDYLPKGRAFSIEREVFPRLAEEGELYGYVFDGLWTDIGEPEDYLKLNRTLLDSLGNMQTHKVGNNVEIKKPVAFDKGVTVGEKSVIGPHSVIGRDVTIGKNVHVQNSVVLPKTVIQDFSFIDDSIIGEEVSIGKKARMKKCIIGDHARIRDNVVIVEGVTVCPAKEVSESVLTPKHIC